jgi:hypothetical protein
MSVAGAKSSDERIEDVDFARDICDLADLGVGLERPVRPDGIGAFGLYSSPRIGSLADAVRPECNDRGALRTEADRERALICMTSAMCDMSAMAAAANATARP